MNKNEQKLFEILISLNDRTLYELAKSLNFECEETSLAFQLACIYFDADQSQLTDNHIQELILPVSNELAKRFYQTRVAVSDDDIEMNLEQKKIFSEWGVILDEFKTKTKLLLTKSGPGCIFTISGVGDIQNKLCINFNQSFTPGQIVEHKKMNMQNMIVDSIDNNDILCFYYPNGHKTSIRVNHKDLQIKSKL